MDKIAQFTVINTYNDLLITKGTLDRNIEDIKAVKRQLPSVRIDRALLQNDQNAFQP